MGKKCVKKVPPPPPPPSSPPPPPPPVGPRVLDSDPYKSKRSKNLRMKLQAVAPGEGLAGLKRLGYALTRIPVPGPLATSPRPAAAVAEAAATGGTLVSELPLATGAVMLSPELLTGPTGFSGLSWPDGTTAALQPPAFVPFDIWLPPNVTAVALFAAGDASTATASTRASTVTTAAGSGPLHCFPSISVEGFTSYQDWDFGGTRTTQVAPSCPQPANPDPSSQNSTSGSGGNSAAVVGAFFGFTVEDSYLDEVVLVRVYLPAYEAVPDTDDFTPNAAMISSLYVSYTKPTIPPALAQDKDQSYLTKFLGFAVQPAPSPAPEPGATITALPSPVGTVTLDLPATVATAPAGLLWPDRSSGILLIPQPPLPPPPTPLTNDTANNTSPSPGNETSSPSTNDPYWLLGPDANASAFAVSLTLPPGVTAVGLYAVPVGACDSTNTRITASAYLASSPGITTSGSSDLYYKSGLCDAAGAPASSLQTRFLAFYVAGLSPGFAAPGSNDSSTPNADRLARVVVHLASDRPMVSLALSFVLLTTESPGTGPFARLDPPGGTASRLEVFTGGSWSSVCQRRMDETTASLICRQFNFTSGKGSSWNYAGDAWLPIRLADVTCAGREVALQECGWSLPQRELCSHNSDATVDCSTGEPLLWQVAGQLIWQIPLMGFSSRPVILPLVSTGSNATGNATNSTGLPPPAPPGNTNGSLLPCNATLLPDVSTNATACGNSSSPDPPPPGGGATNTTTNTTSNTTGNTTGNSTDGVGGSPPTVPPGTRVSELSAGALGVVTLHPPMTARALPKGLTWPDGSTAALELQTNESYVIATLPPGVKAVSITIIGDLCSDVYANSLYNMNITAELAPMRQQPPEQQARQLVSLDQYGFVPSCDVNTVGMPFAFVAVLPLLDDVMRLNISVPTWDDEGSTVNLVVGPFTLWTLDDTGGKPSTRDAAAEAVRAAQAKASSLPAGQPIRPEQLSGLSSLLGRGGATRQPPQRLQP